jgi:lipoprotein NlpD
MEAMSNRNSVRILLLFVLAAMALGGCGEMKPMGERSDLINYTVKPGDTLYSISWRYGYDHRRIAAWNGIKPPFNIYPGQQLRIIAPYQGVPREREEQPSSPATVAAAAPQGAPATAVSAAPARTSRETAARGVEKSGPRLQSKDIDWRWPTSGELRNKFSLKDGKKGLDIEGRMGQEVVAAAGGQVVYSGNGLIGYGNLIIIKHNDHYLSAYGHNRRLLVTEGTEVKQGEKIAEIGDIGKERYVLHFEIRRDGKPVDPLHYLPKQGS